MIQKTMTTTVITVSSRNPKEPYYHYQKFLKSLDRFRVIPVVLGMNQPWHGLMTKAFLYRDYLRAGNLNSSGGDTIILCDAWDIIFQRHPDEIGKLCLDHYDPNAVVFNGEKACWPRADLSDSFPDQGTPWRYLNCGFICGPALAILAMIEAMNIDAIGVDRKLPNGQKIEPNDQGEFQALYSKQPVKMIVDSKCLLAQTLSACTLDEFDLSGEFIKNKVTGTIPGVFHFNGGSKNDLMPAFLKHLGL
ncbi:MAG: hypothetical protein L0312_02025 [Acidobacteria bacterium]|nr:hypothetical protein [Acidobacteriota bacterium]